MMLQNVIPSVCLFVILSSCQCMGACNFPSTWTQSEWFHQYDPAQPSVKWTAKFSTDSYTLYSSDGRELVYECADSVQDGESFYFVSKLPVFPSYKCNQGVHNGQGILFRSVDVDAGTPVSQCQSSITPGTKASWLPRSSPRQPAQKCPFKEGTFPVTYSETAGSTKCANNPNSKVTISGNKLHLSTCYNGSTSYDFPLKTSLTCLGNAAGDILESEDNGNILLLADDSAKTQYYCARYYEEVGVLYLSLNTRDGRQPHCYSSATFTSAETGNYLALQIITDETQTSSTISSPSTTTTSSPVNKPQVPGISDKKLAAIMERFQISMNEVEKPKGSFVKKMRRFRRQAGACHYPASWRTTGLEWMYSYHTTSSYEYKLTFTGGSTSRLVRLDSNGAPQTLTFTCLGQYQTGDVKYTLRQQDSDPDFKECVEFIPLGDNILIMKEIYVGNKGITAASQCVAELEPIDQYRITLKKVNNQYNFNQGSCPFIQGIYQTSIDFEPGQPTKCENDPTSTTTIQGNQISVRSCDMSNSFDKPYFSTFTCIDSWQQSVLDKSVHDNGDYLLLAYTDPHHSRLEYYCARYKVENDKITMSIHVKDTHTTKCETNVNYLQYANEEHDKYRRFVFSLTEKFTSSTASTTTISTTTTPAPPTPVPTTPTPTTTTTDNGGSSSSGACATQPCQNGGTCRIYSTYSTYTCLCPQGYTGPRCTDETNPPGSVGGSALTQEQLLLLVCMIIGLALLIIFIVCIAVCIRQMKRRKEEEANEFFKYNTTYPSDNVSFHNVTFNSHNPSYASSLNGKY